MKPMIMGAVMAALMLFMLHEPLMSGDLNGFVAGAAFVSAHAVLLLGLAGLLLFLPSLRARILAHRPDLRHVGLMLTGLIGTAAVVHGVLHGVLT